VRPFRPVNMIVLNSLAIRLFRGLRTTAQCEDFGQV
jgi:hypothetical protein